MIVSRLVLFGARAYFFSFWRDVLSMKYHHISNEKHIIICQSSILAPSHLPFFFFKSHSTKSFEVRVKFDKQHLRAIRRREQLCVYNLKLFNVLNLGQIRVACSYSVCQWRCVLLVQTFSFGIQAIVRLHASFGCPYISNGNGHCAFSMCLCSNVVAVMRLHLCIGTFWTKIAVIFVYYKREQFTLHCLFFSSVLHVQSVNGFFYLILFYLRQKKRKRFYN